MSECRDHVSGLPLVCILCPLHFFCGGSLDKDDILSWIGMANVEQGSLAVLGPQWYRLVRGHRGPAFSEERTGVGLGPPSTSFRRHPLM